jgi:hypothetical protein
MEVLVIIWNITVPRNHSNTQNYFSVSITCLGIQSAGVLHPQNTSQPGSSKPKIKTTTNQFPLRKYEQTGRSHVRASQVYL